MLRYVWSTSTSKVQRLYVLRYSNKKKLFRAAGPRKYPRKPATRDVPASSIIMEGKIAILVP